MKQNDHALSNDFSRKSKKYRTRYLDELGNLYRNAKQATVEANSEKIKEESMQDMVK